MNPSMLFRYSNSALDIETADEKSVAFNLGVPIANNYGCIRLNEQELVAMRDWLTKQIASIKKNAKSGKPSK